MEEEKIAEKETMQMLESRIHEAYHFLSKTQRRIAKFILENRSFVLQNSITIVAQKLNTTPSSITRFCQALRYKGFNELKFYLANDLVVSSSEGELLRADDGMLNSVRKLAKYNVDALTDTLLLLDMDKVSLAISSIIRAEKVYFYGEGGTGSAAEMGYHLLLQVGIASNCFTDAALMLLAASHLTSRDVVICMSYSGAAENILTAMQFIKKSKATIIAITAFPKSRFAKRANICLCYSCNIQDDLQYLHTARICELAIIGVLQPGLINQMKRQSDERLNILKSAITSKRA